MKAFQLPVPNPELYRTAKPFPHAVFDGVLSDGFEIYTEATTKLARIVAGSYKYDNALEYKRAEDRMERIPMLCMQTLREMNSPEFLQWLEELTGKRGLIPDPYYRGGGMHMIPPGGKLDVHIDYNIHPILKLSRELNVLVYLNPGWTGEDGGELELWAGAPDERKLERCVESIRPELGRMVVFSTSERSYHGHPNPTGGRWRLSLSTYYYTAPTDMEIPHSTVFVKRPGDPDDPEADALRAKRAQGRVTSEVKVQGRND